VDRDELRRLWREAGAARAALPAAAAPPVATFMAAPAGSADALLGADLAAVGLPLGGWSSASAAVRAASQRKAGWLAAAGRETGVRVVDYGDVAVDAADLGATFVRAHEHLADVLAAGATPLPLGGDASITVPALQMLAGKLQGRPGSSARRAPGCRRGHRGGAPARLSRPLLARRHAASSPSRGPWVSLPKREFHRVGEPRGRHFKWSKRNPLGGPKWTAFEPSRGHCPPDREANHADELGHMVHNERAKAPSAKPAARASIVRNPRVVPLSATTITAQAGQLQPNLSSGS
jgi:Arginase family